MLDVGSGMGEQDEKNNLGSSGIEEQVGRGRMQEAD